MDFFRPSWKKFYWLLLVYLISEIYSTIIIGLVPFALMANFISFVLNPATLLFAKASGMEQDLVIPFAKTIDLAWMYFVATILAKEISKDKE
jgi:hypothetical protein